jgi:lipopolysaccharide biosynthesis glycosyltransferase
MREVLNVVFTIDESFVQHFSVALVSILENNKDLETAVYVIHNIKNTIELDGLISFIRKVYNVNLNAILLDDSVFDKYKITHHFSKAIYFRLLLTDILPDQIDRILYLDSDVLVTGSLKELIKLDFNNNYLFAAEDGELDNIQRLNDIGIPLKRYFNSGVMLINLKAWRSDHVSNKLIYIANEYMDRIKWWDQDILNICFLNKWSMLQPKYNAMHLTEKLEQTPIIVHYNSPTKPWQYLNYHPYKYLYWKYIKLTPFKKVKFTDFTYKRLLKKVIYKLINKKYKVV